ADLFPTVCAMIGVPVPFGVQGRNLLPLLRGEPVPPHEFDVAYSESGFGGLPWTEDDGLTLPAEGACDEEFTRFDCLNTWTQCGQLRMARKGDWKIQCDMLGKTYLYNLKEDPFELRDLSQRPELAGIKAEMLAELAAAMMRASDPLPPPHHRYRIKRHPDGFWRDPGFTTGDPGITKI
ncbi:MAG: sulfatase, partial [Clostridia bacterium]|nr:sulfatase [Clostridia bacterium]